MTIVTEPLIFELADGSEQVVAIEAEIRLGRPGCRCGHPDYWTEDEPAEIDLIAVRIAGNTVPIDIWLRQFAPENRRVIERIAENESLRACEESRG